MPNDVDVEFFFDPICPFAWITSRWVLEVAELRDISIEWRFIALAIVNEGTDYSTFPAAYPALHGVGRSMLRVAADDDSWDSVLREETELCLGRTGRDVGTPILTWAPGTDREASLFGPVISTIPRGDAALELWDAVQTLARTPGFSEIKRSMRDHISYD
jgi:hypothetical protein